MEGGNILFNNYAANLDLPLNRRPQLFNQKMQLIIKR